MFIPRRGRFRACWERCSLGVREPDGGGKLGRSGEGAWAEGRLAGPWGGCGGAGRGWRMGRRRVGLGERAGGARGKEERAGGARGCGGRGARCLGPASHDLTSSPGGGAAWDAGGPSRPFPLRCSFPTQASVSGTFYVPNHGNTITPSAHRFCGEIFAVRGEPGGKPGSHARPGLSGLSDAT